MSLEKSINRNEKKVVLLAYHYLLKKIIITNIMWKSFIGYEKSTMISINKKPNGPELLKNDNHPPSPSDKY